MKRLDWAWRGMGMLGLCGVLLVALACCGKSGGNGATTDPAAQDPQADGPNAGLAVVTFEIKGESFELEMALDSDAVIQGLSDRQTIGEDEGMFFDLGYTRPATFVMRRCYFPIDLIFVDDEGYVDSLHRMEVIQPVEGELWHNPRGGYSSSGRVRYAIELPGGTLDRLGLERNEKIELPEEALQLMAE